MQEGGCAVLPLSLDYPDFYGVFATSKIKKGETIFQNGTYEISHSSVCEQIGVEPEDCGSKPLSNLAVPRKTRFASAKSSNKKYKVPKHPRHIYSFLQSEKNFASKSDFGSKKNFQTKWVDLVANKSPTFFINSVDKGDGRSHNILFTVGTDGNNEYSMVTARRDIEPFEELVGDYFERRKK